MLPSNRNVTVLKGRDDSCRKVLTPSCIWRCLFRLPPSLVSSATMARSDDEMEDVQEARPARIRSTVTAVRKQKGRGFRDDGMEVEDERNVGNPYEGLERTSRIGPQKSVEGWVIFVSGVHEEAQEEDIVEQFMDFGVVKNCYLNLDRRTGFVKGYAMVEYETQKEAQTAIDGMNGQEFLTQPLQVTWCFSSGPNRKPRRGR